ncbi:hypothetical protein FQN53_005055 [Emmonsiellopsis sp. PD_33]|nr:hypothetical protein FQN53_005055 [Emmonsiellopsis sp. PD_33]
MPFCLPSPSRPRYIRINIVATLILCLIILTLLNLRSRSISSSYRFPSRNPHGDSHHAPDIPAEYSLQQKEAPFCAERYNRGYLDGLRNSSTEFCAPGSSSNLTCFHSRTIDERLDSFCVAKPAAFIAADEKFQIGCALTDTARPKFENFPAYWYETGPRRIFQDFVNMNGDIKTPGPSSSYTILIKREGATNLWHCLMEIFAMTLTIDVLRTTLEPASNAPFFASGDPANTQVVILDDREDGPYFDLWRLFARKPITRLKDIPEGGWSDNIIIPLPGQSNPVWQGDWKMHDCENSALVQTFSNRVLAFYDIKAPARNRNKVVLTYIDRKETRSLVNSESYLEAIKNRFPYVRIQSIDFAAIPFKKQLEVIQGTDVLVGVHGAGLTHSMFLRKGSAVVEIQPAELDHKGFHNLANLMGNTYFGARALDKPPTLKRDWHSEDVFLDKVQFIELVGEAVKSMYSNS